MLDFSHPYAELKHLIKRFKCSTLHNFHRYPNILPNLAPDYFSIQ
jgi:hypothetical protein